MYNYHTHPNTCPHAEGTFEEFIKEAIKNDFDGLGFSDHVMLPDVKPNIIRATFDKKDFYVSSIKNLKEKYKSKIKIYIGFECEWFSKYINYYKSLLDNHEVDYLIFGNHPNYIKNNVERGYKVKNRSAYLKRYVDKSVKALNSGLFKIMAHPDIFMCYTPWNKKTEEISRIICKEAKKNNVALELNMGPTNSGKLENLFSEVRYAYPYKKFWEIAKEMGNTIVIGYDAHRPSVFSGKRNKKEIREFADKLNLSITDKLDI